MLREIKFRVWQINHKVMCKVKNVHFNDNGDIESITLLYPESHASQIITYSDSNKLFWMCDKDGKYVLELMQYTGLKDKNDKEIYEGDIVVAVNIDDTFTGVVVFDLEELDFKVTNGKKNYRNNFSYLCTCEEIEIIGNIYENPELLEGEENDSN